jgi:hypothetical protein
MVRMERRQHYQFQPRRNFERNKGRNEPKVPVPIDVANMVNQEDHPWYQCCQDFHEEASCPEYQARS